MNLEALLRSLSPTYRKALTGEVVSLGQRNLYMFPTRNGFIFSLLLFVLLLAAINYENGLNYVLTFWLGATAVISMLHTHRNLLGLTIIAGPSAPVFAGEQARFSVCLVNDRHLPRLGLVASHNKQELGQIDLEANGRACVPLTVTSKQRGHLAMPTVRLSTRYPVGLFYSWSRRLELDHHCLVYPRPGPSRPFVHAKEHSLQREVGVRAEGDDFIGVRDYQYGDPPRHIDWKAAARGQGLHTKRFGGDARASVWLDWDVLTGLGTEDRLSQLCRWVLDAETQGMVYGLRIPGAIIEPASGEAHSHVCLKALALFED